MLSFISENAVSLIIVALGLLAWVITIGARISSKRTGHYVSGIPGVGGVLIIAGFLTSSVKWLALIGLLDLDLWYFIVIVIPGIIRVEKDLRRYVPPGELEGGKVIMYSDYRKEFEEIRFPTEYPGSYELHSINRYVIVSKDEHYVLLKTEINTRIITRVECRSVDECKMHASSKAKWTAMQT